MSQVIADLEAILRFRNDGGSELVNQLKRIIDISDALAKEVNPLKGSAAEKGWSKLSDLTKQQRTEYASLSQVMTNNIAFQVRELHTLYSALSNAGVPVNNLKATFSGLESHITRVLQLVEQLNTKFKTGHQAFKSQPFSVESTADAFNVKLPVNTTGAFMTSLKSTYQNIDSMTRAISEAQKKVGDLLNTKQATDFSMKAFAEVGSNMRTVGADIKNIVTLLTEANSVLSGFVNNINNITRNLRGGINATSASVTQLANNIKDNLTPAYETLAKTAAAANALTGAGSPRLTKEAAEVRRAAQVALEQERAQHAAAQQAAQAALDQKKLEAKEALVAAESLRMLAKAQQTVATTTGAAASASAQATASTAANTAATNANTAAKQNNTQAAAAAVSASSLLSNLMNQLGTYAMAATGPLGRAAGSLMAFSYAQQQLGFQQAATVAGLSSLVTAFVGFGAAAIRVEKNLGAVRELHVQLGRVVGQDGVQNYNMLTEVMIKYGLSLEALSKPIARLKLATDGTVLGGDKFRGFLEDFSAVASKFALPQEAIGGMAKAFEQMISKGTVQAEEFRQQLGDRLPAAAMVGLKTFQAMTGNAGASFSDFMNAMKDRQIESTRFLDIFMIKLKEMFGVTNEATNNLAASYGRLGSSYDVMINNLDRSIGFTRAWGAGLNLLSTAMQGIAASAGVIGPAMAVAFGGGALAGFAAVLPYLKQLAPIMAGLVTASGALRVAWLALQAVLAGQFASAVAQTMSSLYSWVTNSSKAVDALSGKLTSEKFKVNLELADKDPKVLVNEVARYLINAESALKQGKALIVDVNLAPELDKGIERIKEKLYDIGAVYKKMDLSAFSGDIQSAAEKATSFITKERVLAAALNKDLSDGLKAEILNIKDLYDRAEAASKLNATKTAARDVKNSVEQIQRLEDFKRRYLDIQRQIDDAARSGNLAGGGGGGGFLGSLQSAATGLMPVLRSVATVLGAIAAANLLGLATGFGSVGQAVATLGGRLQSVHSRLLLIGAAAAALTLLTNNARAAENGASGLADEGKRLVDEIKQQGEAFKDVGRVQTYYAAAQTSVEGMRARLSALKIELADVNNSWRRNIGELPKDVDSTTAVLRQKFTDLTGFLRGPYDVKKDIETVEAALKILEPILIQLGPTHAKLAAEVRDAARAFNEEAGAMGAVLNKADSINAAVDKVRTKIDLLKSGGLGALRSYDQLEGVKSRFNITDKDGPDALSAAKELARAEDELAQRTRDATAAASGRRTAQERLNKTMNDYTAIIERADSIIDGDGMKNANFLRKIIKDVYDYEEALRKTGSTASEAASRAQQFRAALEMQAAGINMAALQLKPLEAMQTGMVNFSNTLADMMVNGKMNAHNFANAFKQMAQSIIKDIIAMAIRASIVKPLLQGIFGTGLFGGSGGGIGSWSTSTIAFAKGGVVDQPTFFGMGGSKSGLMGEAGTEAIMPLRRGADGALGVAMYDTSRRQEAAAPQEVNLTVTVVPGPEFDVRVAQTANDAIVRASPTIVRAAVDTTNKTMPSMIKNARSRSM